MPAPRKVVRRSDNENKNIKTQAAFEEFISEKIANGLVEETLSSYEITFKKFMDYFESQVENTYDIDSAMFTQWKHYMKGVEKLKETTVNHHISNIRESLNKSPISSYVLRAWQNSPSKQESAGAIFTDKRPLTLQKGAVPPLPGRREIPSSSGKRI